MPDVEPSQPEDLTDDEIKARNQRRLLDALQRTGKHIHGLKPRPGTPRHLR